MEALSLKADKVERSLRRQGLVVVLGTAIKYVEHVNVAKFKVRLFSQVFNNF